MEIKVGSEVVSPSGQVRRYLLVSGFDTTSKDHWIGLRRMALTQLAGISQALVVHFMDLLQHYEPSPIGELVGEPYIHRVIAQYVQTNQGKRLFFSDPFGVGYEEPGEIPEDFGIEPI
jgi:hypothetical protein